MIGATDRALTPTGVVALLIMAFVLDYMSLGKDSLRDRLAFLCALAGFRDGFDGSPLDQWTVQRASEGITFLLAQTKGAYIAGASVNAIVSIGVSALALYGLGCVLPTSTKLTKVAGRWTALDFPRSPAKRINIPLWIVALLLGMTADLGRGALGTFANGSVEMLTWAAKPIPMVLLGAA